MDTYGLYDVGYKTHLGGDLYKTLKDAQKAAKKERSPYIFRVWVEKKKDRSEETGVQIRAFGEFMLSVKEADEKIYSIINKQG